MIVVGMYAPETNVNGIVIMELIVWNDGEFLETTARNKPMALKLTAEINMMHTSRMIWITVTCNPKNKPAISVTNP